MSWAWWPHLKKLANNTLLKIRIVFQDIDILDKSWKNKWTLYFKDLSFYIIDSFGSETVIKSSIKLFIDYGKEFYLIVAKALFLLIKFLISDHDRFITIKELYKYIY